MKRNAVTISVLAVFGLCPLVVAPLVAPLAAQERTPFRHITIADGLSQGAVSAIVQDHRGFMWLGTKDGLNRYDGHQFVVFRNDPLDSTTISSSDITAVFEDSRRQLWVGTRDGGINRFDRARERFERIHGGPSGDVAGFAEDRSGHIWAAAGGEGLFRLSVNGPGAVVAERFVHSDADSTGLSGGRVRSVLVDRRGELWVGTDLGLSRRVSSPGKPIAFAVMQPGTEAAGGLIDFTAAALYEDSRGRLWVGSRPGMTMLDSARRQTRHFFHRYRTFRYGWGEAIGVVEDRAGRIWITTRAELMRLDPSSGTYSYVRHEPQDPESINSDLPTAIYRDRSDLLWLGTNGYGLNVHDPKANRFQTFRRPDAWPSRLSGFSVYSMFEDSGGTLYVGAGLLYKWNRATGALNSFETSSDRPNDFGNTSIWTVIEESPGVLWAASIQGLYRYETATGRSRLYRYDVADTTGLPEQGVYDVFRDRDGVLWAVTENFLAKLTDPVRGRFSTWRHKERATERQWIFPSLTQDGQGAFWLGSDQGLTRFEPLTQKITRFTHDTRDPQSLSSNAVRAILADPREPARYLWIGTAGGGLNRLDLSTGKSMALTERDGLPNNVVYGVLPDPNGSLWLSTNKGLSRFDPAIKRFRNYDANDGLQGNEFNSGAAYRSRSGELFFGGTEGFSYFRPETVTDNPHVPAVAVTGFRRGNRYETVRDSATALRTTISETDTLRLSYQDAVLTFEFAALEYSAPVKNQFAYRMVGFNDDWFESGAVRAATYTNLPPGSYTFQVRASNNDGVWNLQGTSIVVVINPPWWRTPWAYMFYVAIAFAVLTAARRYEVARVRLASRLEREHLETEQLRRLDRARSQLFANVSHEFRTPLTLTMGPLDDLRSGMHGPLSPSVSQQVDLARRSAGRMLDLVNEVLELARAEAGRVTVRARPLELMPFVESVALSFAPLAERKSIAYDVVTQLERRIVFTDPELLERVLSNVLANAFKFTPDGGTIQVSVAHDEGASRITIRDNGPGIPSDDVGQVFDRFHRAPSTASTHPGTGIGLALARELLGLLGGTIGAESEEGHGSSFVITLPAGRSHLLPSQLVADEGAIPWTARIDSSFTPQEMRVSDSFMPDMESTEISDDVTTVLIVDDNADILAYVRQHLAPLYGVLEAKNGKEGLELARRHLPDLVLSDVMMPVMDGVALCRALKTDPETDFMPVILLTARAEAEDRLTGLAERADDYLTKPFNVPELLARIANTIATRRQLRERYASAGAIAAKSAGVPAGVLSADQKFVVQVRAAIEANLADDGFTVERLATAVAQSRGNLHRRLREVVGETPSELIRRLRLERAAELLDADAGSVAEVAYAVGFKSVAHFSNAFMALHGHRPSGWRLRSSDLLS